MPRAECSDCGATMQERAREGRSIMVCPWFRGTLTSEPFQSCGAPFERVRDGNIQVRHKAEW